MDHMLRAIVMATCLSCNACGYIYYIEQTPSYKLHAYGLTDIRYRLKWIIYYSVVWDKIYGLT